MNTTGLSKCPRCGSIISGHHECSQLGVSGVTGKAVYEFWPPTGRRLDADFRRSWELLGELLAQLDRAYKLGGGVAESNAPVAPGEVQESRPAAPAESENKPSYWLSRAAGALDCAVQFGTEYGEEIDAIERRCDEIAAKLKEAGR